MDQVSGLGNVNLFIALTSGYNVTQGKIWNWLELILNHYVLYYRYLKLTNIYFESLFELLELLPEFFLIPIGIIVVSTKYIPE